MSQSAVTEPSDVQVADEGFTVLVDPTEATSDIVFIHGIQGHPKRTWLWKDPSWNPLKDKRESCYWPATLLPKEEPLKQCRILTYGYDSHVSHFFSGAANQTNINGHAKVFLDEFEELRRKDPDRKLVFVVHSLGGLLLKAILKRAADTEASSGDNAVCKVCPSIIGAIFLGTPHRGSDYSDLGRIIAHAAGAIQFDKSTNILRDMKVDSAILEVLNEIFEKIVRAHKFSLVTFAEGRGPGIPLVARDKIVPSWSAHIGLGRALEEESIINADHRSMCRYENAKAPGYGQVRRAIERCLQRSATADGTFEQALKNLWTPETSARIDSVDQAYQNTFEWIFTDHSLGYLDWLRSSASLYWIRGKPASGKSTMLKMIVKDVRTINACNRPGHVVSLAAYFFHDRGSYLQKTLEGLLREILSKIVEDVPTLRALFQAAYTTAQKGTARSTRGIARFQWTWEIMLVLFQDILRQETVHLSLVLFLDALDEYSGKKVDVVRFLQTMQGSGKTRLKVCFSSRPEQIFLDEFANIPGFSIHEYTRTDIATVIRSGFLDNARMRLTLALQDAADRLPAEQLQVEIADLANGVFLWTRLIVEELLLEYTNGRSVGALSQILRSIPPELDDYYTYMVANRLDPKYKAERQIMIDILQCTGAPPFASHFFEIFQLASIREFTDCHIVLPTIDEARRLIQSRCGSLIDLNTRNSDIMLVPNSRLRNDRDGLLDNHPDLDLVLDRFDVQFLHQTVKTWSMKLNGQLRRQPSKNGQVYLLRWLAWKSINRVLNYTTVNTMLQLIHHAAHATTYHYVTDILCMLEPIEVSREPSTAMNILFPQDLWSTTSGFVVGTPGLTLNSLHLTALAGSPKLMSALLNKPRSIQTQSLFADFCQHLAREHLSLIYDEKIVRMLVDATKGGSGEQIWPAFLDLVQKLTDLYPGNKRRRWCLNILEQVLSQGIDPNVPFCLQPGGRSYFILHRVLEPTHGWESDERNEALELKAARLLLRHVTNINALDSDLSTILDMAYLRIKQAALYYKDSSGKRPITKVLISKELEFCTFLLDSGAMVSGQYPGSILSAEELGFYRVAGFEADERLLYPPKLRSSLASNLITAATAYLPTAITSFWVK